MYRSAVLASVEPGSNRRGELTLGSGQALEPSLGEPHSVAQRGSELRVTGRIRLCPSTFRQSVPSRQQSRARRTGSRRAVRTPISAGCDKSLSARAGRGTHVPMTTLPSSGLELADDY